MCRFCQIFTILNRETHLNSKLSIQRVTFHLIAKHQIARYTLFVKRNHPTLLVDSIILLLCISFLLVISSSKMSQGGGYLNVESPEGSYRYSLSVDRQVIVHGPLGETLIEIHDGEARILDSACPTKSCTHQSPIDSGNDWIACLPNQVLLTIVGSESQPMEVDDVAN